MLGSKDLLRYMVLCVALVLNLAAEAAEDQQNPTIKAESTAQETKAEPTAQETKAEPTAQETKAEPAAQESKAEPTAQETKAEPAAQESKAEPVAQETKEESSGQETKEEQEAKEEPILQEPKAEQDALQPGPVVAEEPTSDELVSDKQIPSVKLEVPEKADQISVSCDSCAAFLTPLLSTSDQSGALQADANMSKSYDMQEMQRLAQLIQKCLGELRLCSQEVRADGCHVNCNLPERDALTFQREVQRDLSEFRRISSQLELVVEALGVLKQKQVSSILFKGFDLPPGELCSGCAELNDAIVEIRYILSRDHVRYISARRGLAEQDYVLDEYKALIKQWCAARETIISFDGQQVRQNLYFTWTQTWQSVQKIKTTLLHGSFQDLCSTPHFR